ncbi:MAG: hypothetical protein JWR68_2074 [Polaromonas sp.]|nr:hypothetical protein [Polaromonas sp.]
MAISATLDPSSWREPVLEQLPERLQRPERPAQPEQTGPPENIRLVACDGSPVRYGVLDVPRLVAGKTSPRFSLVLLLSRAPAAGEEAIGPLLLSSYLGMELDYRLPAGVAGQLQVEPLFARQATVGLHAGGAAAVAVASLSTPLLRGALHAPLTREQTLAVLDALDGAAGPLTLQARITYRAAAPAASFTFDTSPADVWDRLKAHAIDGAVSEEAFRQVFDGLNLPAEAFPAFRRVCQCLLVPDPQAALLGRRPAPASTRLQEEWRQASMRHLDLCCPLEAVLGNALTAADRAACISVVGPSGSLDGGPLLKTLSRSTSRTARGAIGMGAMLAGGKVQTVAATLQPSARPSATAHLLASEAIRIQQPVSAAAAAPAPAVSLAAHYVLPEAVFLSPAIMAVSLPVLGNLDAPLLNDKNNPALRWYLPALTLVKPAPSDAPEGSAFLFELEGIGSGSSGRPAIRATLRFTLALSASAAATAALAATPRLAGRMIEPVQPSVTLSIPYIDEISGTLKRASYRGTTARAGDRLQVTVELLNDAARTAYGALSTPGFQSEAARLEVAYQFSAYVPVFNRPQLVLGGKISHAVLLQRPRDDAEAIFVASGGREFIVRPGAAHLAPQNFTLAGRISNSAAALALPDKIEYAQRTTIRQQSLEAFFPCAELGSFYREKQAAATVAIGCAEAYRLGQASPLTYQEVVALNRPGYRVFRNLKQPGRFLLVPLAYEITRYAPDTPERAYRPALIVYAALDAERPENNRIRFEAMLGPALSAHEFEDLRRRLLLEAASPVLELPNMLAQRTEFSWNLTATPPVEAVTSATPECLHAALSTDLASALLLKTLIQNTGLTGAARFFMEDASVVTSALSVHLGRITGPWLAGPVALQANGDTLQLTNRIESPVAVKDVYLFNGSAEPVRVPVEAAIAPGASRDIAAPGPYTVAQADCAAMAGSSPTFEEVRAMIEEIQCNVVFLDVVNYENHGLTRIDIDARLQGVPGVFRVGMDKRRGAVNFLLPLTTYLATRIVEFQLTRVFAGQPDQVTAWRAWDMEANSNIVTVTAEMISG